MDNKLSAPLSTLRWVNRDSLKPNDYNPNKVSKENLKLLIQSILTNGWTLPIVVRPDMTIIDGFHRWTVAGMEPEEIFRLSDFSKEDFLKMMTKGVTGYSKAEFITKI